MGLANFLTDTKFLQHIELAEMDLDLKDEVVLITWNPNDKYISPLNVDLKWQTMVCRYLKHIKRCSKAYCIAPELSIQGRLHVHGWIVITDKIKWLKSVRPRLDKSGKLKTPKMHSYNAIKTYYKKDHLITPSILRMSAPYTHLNHDEYLQYYLTKLLEDPKKKKEYNKIDMTTYFDWPDVIEV